MDVGQRLDETLVFRCDVTGRREDDGLPGQRNVRPDQRHGRVRHIPSPDVEQPRHGVGCAHEKAGGFLLLDRLLHAGDL